MKRALREKTGVNFQVMAKLGCICLLRRLLRPSDRT